MSLLKRSEIARATALTGMTYEEAKIELQARYEDIGIFDEEDANPVTVYWMNNRTGQVTNLRLKRRKI